MQTTPSVYLCAQDEACVLREETQTLSNETWYYISTDFSESQTLPKSFALLFKTFVMGGPLSRNFSVNVGEGWGAESACYVLYSTLVAAKNRAIFFLPNPNIHSNLVATNFSIRRQHLPTKWSKNQSFWHEFTVINFPYLQSKGFSLSVHDVDGGEEVCSGRHSHQLHLLFCLCHLLTSFLNFLRNKGKEGQGMDIFGMLSWEITSQHCSVTLPGFRTAISS